MVPPKLNIITSIYIISDLLKLRMLSSFQKMELNLECRFWHIFKGRYFFGKVSLLFAAWHFQIGILSFSRSLYTKIYSIIIHICNVYIIISMYVSICVYVYIYMYIHVKYIYTHYIYIYAWSASSFSLLSLQCRPGCPGPPPSSTGEMTPMMVTLVVATKHV